MNLRFAICDLRSGEERDVAALAIAFQSQIANRKSQMFRSGFTVLELSIGLVITAMILAAVAAIVSAAGQGWSEQNVSQSTQMQANQVYARLQKVLAAAKYVAQVTPGSVDGSGVAASLFFWRSDDYPDGATMDGTPQVGEMALIQQDSATKTLWLYQAIPYSQMTPTQLTAAGLTMTWAQMTDPTAPGTFIKLSFVKAQVIGGPGYTSTGSGLKVVGTQLSVNGLSGTNQLPVIEFSLGFSKDGESLTLYGSSTLRGPTKQPS